MEGEGEGKEEGREYLTQAVHPQCQTTQSIHTGTHTHTYIHPYTYVRTYIHTYDHTSTTDSNQQHNFSVPPHSKYLTVSHCSTGPPSCPSVEGQVSHYRPSVSQGSSVQGTAVPCVVSHQQGLAASQPCRGGGGGGGCSLATIGLAGTV